MLHTAKKSVPIDIPNLNYGNTEIQCQHNVKLLGVRFNDTLFTSRSGPTIVNKGKTVLSESTPFTL